MSVSIKIEVTRDGVTPRLQRMVDALSMERMNAAVGPAVARLTQRHLRGLGTNKRGWPTTNFWARAAKATDWRGTAEGPVISINQIGVRQRYFGGVIKPVNARALTIPISPVAYGRTPSEFPDAFVLKTKKGAFLVQKSGEPQANIKETQAARGKRMRGLGGNAKRRLQATLNFLFKLVESVNQEADPDVLPSKEEIGQVAKEALLRAIKPEGQN